jgi:glycosyltransferase involved in cell wall biosynthesis
MPDTTIVIPCYNEADRLDIDCFVQYMAHGPACRFVLVDDGSRDDTLLVLDALRECDPAHFDVLPLERNRGKAEAVRRGVLMALERQPRYVGYWDADLATPLQAITAFRQRLDEDRQVQAVFGARVKMLGRKIDRRLTRHLLGRVFATGASITLGLGVYDTQCGAKLFRAGDATRKLFEKPFITNWIFDVELVARMIQTLGGPAAVERAICEEPLWQWTDVDGSKVRPRDFFKAIFELAAIYRKYLLATSPRAASTSTASEPARSDQAIDNHRKMDHSEPAVLDTTEDVVVAAR